MLLEIFQDALFAAIAAIGFAAISNPPRRAYLFCAVIAAAGHACRFFLMNCPLHAHIVPATLIAALVVGTLAVFLSPLSRTPAETCLFPALLPMIPGIYAYRAFGGLALCVLRQGSDTFERYFQLFMQNGLVCAALLFCLVLGGSIPIFIFKKISFQATR